MASQPYRFRLNGTNLCDLTLEDCVLRLRAGGPDTLQLSYAFDPCADNSAYHATNDTVTLDVQTINDDGDVTSTTTLFQGRIKPERKNVGIPDSTRSYTASSGWDDMRKIILTQSTKSYNPSTVSIDDVDIPRVLLGQGDDGNLQTTGDTMQEIIAHAEAAGANITPGTIDASTTFAATEVKDASCDQALRQILALHPDHVAWIEGSNTALHIRQPSNLSTVTVNAENEAFTVQVSDRDDEVPAGVILTFEVTHEIDGETRVERYQQSAGSASGWPPPIHMTIPLAGAKITYNKQRVETRTIPDPEELDGDSAINFYKGLIPQLEGADNSDLQIANQTVTFADPKLDEINEAGDDVANPNSRPVDRDGASEDDFPRMLVSGSVESWMGDGSLKQWEATLKADITYTGDDPEIAHFIGTQINLSETITITNALPKTYKETDQFISPETPLSEDLATEYYNAISNPLDEGTVSGNLAGEHIDIRPGKRLVISDHFTDPTIITESSFDCLSHTFNATFGGSEFLTPKTLTELAQALNKNQPTWKTPEERTQAKAGVGEKAIQSAGNPVTRFASPGSSKRAARKWDLIILDAEDAEVQVSSHGTIKRTTAVDNSGTVNIQQKNADFSVSSGDFLVLKCTRELEVSLEKLDTWTGFPYPIEAEQSDPPGVWKMLNFYHPLFTFVDADDSIPTDIRINEDLYARKLTPETDFRFQLTRQQTLEGNVVSAYELAPSFGAAP